MPQPSAGDVLIRQTAVGLNFVDTYFRRGLYPWPVQQNLTLGTEGAGVVEAVGPEVSGFAIGDRAKRFCSMPRQAASDLWPGNGSI